MGAIDQQAIPTIATRIVSGAATYKKGVIIEDVTHVDTGHYRVTMSKPINAQEQFPYLTLCGTDPTADGSANPVFIDSTDLYDTVDIYTNLAGSPADVDVYFLIEQIRIENTKAS